MLTKFFILFALLPLSAGIILRKFCFQPDGELGEKNALLSGRKVCEEVLSEGMEFQEGKEFSQRSGMFQVPEGVLDSKNLEVIGELLMVISLAKLSGKAKTTLIMRERSILKFNVLIPMFVLVICIFGVLAKSLLPLYALYLALAVIGIVSLSCLYLTVIRRQAAHLAVKAAKSVPFLVRQEDELDFYQYIKSYAYIYSVPFSKAKRLKIDKEERDDT